ncbi:MAG: glycosyltransferase family 2 protein [Maribacter arcticus]|uniref:glycosyltransferase family 2 protein n=1 Tax=Maribacter arcticus TaxID=561365 RepID=UPI0030020090
MMISVCMAVYNGEEFIKEQLDSILLQLGKQDEVIISDDGSTDQTLAIIETYNDARISTHYSGKRSIIKNFENSLKRATGDVVFLADQDDIWYPNKVAITLSYLNEYDLVFSNASVFKENTEQSYLLYEKGVSRIGLLRNFVKNNYIGATMAFKRGVLDKALPFPPNIYMHDVWLAMLVELKGKTFFIEQPLIYYRRHGNNASETSEKSSNGFGVKMRMRFNLALSLLRRLL